MRNNLQILKLAHIIKRIFYQIGNFLDWKGLNVHILYCLPKTLFFVMKILEISVANSMINEMVQSGVPIKGVFVTEWVIGLTN